MSVIGSFFWPVWMAAQNVSVSYTLLVSCDNPLRPAQMCPFSCPWKSAGTDWPSPRTTYGSHKHMLTMLTLFVKHNTSVRMEYLQMFALPLVVSKCASSELPKQSGLFCTAALTSWLSILLQILQPLYSISWNSIRAGGPLCKALSTLMFPSLFLLPSDQKGKGRKHKPNGLSSVSARCVEQDPNTLRGLILKALRSGGACLHSAAAPSLPW